MKVLVLALWLAASDAAFVVSKHANSRVGCSENSATQILASQPLQSSKFHHKHVTKHHTSRLNGVSKHVNGSAKQICSASYIARLIMGLEESLAEMGVTSETHENVLSSVESMALLIHESMSVPSRNYHAVHHVFDVTEGLDGTEHHKDPISVISALFHDVVYYHVDGGLSEWQQEKLHDCIRSGQLTEPHGGENGSAPGSINYVVQPHAANEIVEMVESIFGFQEGQHVDHSNGLNEFLSAVIAVQELEPFVPRGTLAEISVCIEATIPFRANNPETGKSCMVSLYERLVSTNDHFALGLSQDQMVRAVQRAAAFSNADVINFGTDDVVWFMDNAWSLLPESNLALRRKYLYKVQDYQSALFKMYRFLCFLQSDRIFYRFRGSPSPETIAEREANANHNLQVGRNYVGAKILSLSILSAFAELTGGDAPISLFVGDLPTRQLDDLALQHKSVKKVRMYPPITRDSSTSTIFDPKDSVDADVYNILWNGRHKEMAFDTRESPMAAYFYQVLGADEMIQILKDINVCPMTEDSAWELLRRLPRELIAQVAEMTAKNAVSRSDKIWTVMDSL